MATIETSVEKSRWGALFSLLNKRVAAYRKHLLINFGLFICSEMKGQFDITFPALQCSIISVDAMDISGLEHLDVVRIELSFSLYHSLSLSHE